MKVAVIRHGVGREGKRVLGFLEKTIYKDLKKIKGYDFEYFYLFRYIKNESSIRNNENNLTSQFSALSYEKVINVDLPENFYIDFKSFFKNDVHKDNFQAYKNLLNQCFMFKKFRDEVDINKFSSFIVIRDDVLFLKYGDLKKLISNSQVGYVTSIWDWEGGVHERFFMCPSTLFYRLTFKYENLRDLSLLKKRTNPFHYCGEVLSLKIIKRFRFKIFSYNIKTQRVREGFRLQKERFRIRIHDPYEFINIIDSLIWTRIIFPFLSFFKINGTLNSK